MFVNYVFMIIMCIIIIICHSMFIIIVMIIIIIVTFRITPHKKSCSGARATMIIIVMIIIMIIIMTIWRMIIVMCGIHKKSCSGARATTPAHPITLELDFSFTATGFLAVDVLLSWSASLIASYPFRYVILILLVLLFWMPHMTRDPHCTRQHPGIGYSAEGSAVGGGCSGLG